MSEPSLNQKVHSWAQSHVGQLVGSGECWDLAARALQSAGAASSVTTGPQDDYVWGIPIGLHELRPGDILQFRNHAMSTTTVTSVTFGDGSGYDRDEQSTEQRAHHTAVVAATRSLSKVEVFEQNVKPLGKRVQRHTIAVISVPPVVETSLRNMKDSGGHMRPAKVVVTTTIEVSGRVWAYRPKARN